jgi:predicted  nucleic acid-binding Zn-ribbon protein
MAADVVATLRKALTDLRSEKSRVDRQISALETALSALNGQRPTGAPSRRRRGMSAQARKALGKRMKAYWAKKRAMAAKGKAQGSSR